ncbi:MAG TPA: Txe/YoeB family addiction module toxin [Cyanobacteria bacterium UBA9971]|nr:Txe/YoeB family addiction module toxin [Cyanobacteria bacterium UBA9971]
MYEILLTKQAVKDAKKVENSNLKERILNLITIIKSNPFIYPPEFEFLNGFSGIIISRRINKQHRLVYQVLEKENIIKILRMWTHYE